MMITGAVQGIGFRPFMYRLAQQMQVNGWVSNIPQGVIAEIEGNSEVLDDYIRRMTTEKPALASVQSCEVTVLDASGYHDFQIRESNSAGEKRAVILPDIAVCPDCLTEFHDIADRRYHYPFINCTNCGPRWSIMESLPYDRANTSMKQFTMCPECEREYQDPANRRFHAQPNACPDCGPRVQLVSAKGEFLAEGEQAIDNVIEAIFNGMIVAVKGIGGFHLMTDACSDDAVRRLRQRKHRDEKPFAVMMPDVETADHYCRMSEKEFHALRGTAAPIVLVRKRNDIEGRKQLSALIAPNNPLLGILLPYAPLHHGLMKKLNQPVIATSGNIADEPICTDDQDALDRLGGIADLVLLHNRPIVRHADDSIVRIVADREMVLRRGRGLAPLPVVLDISTVNSILAVGGHLKNTIALNVGTSVFVSQHIGDLETAQSLQTFQRTIEDIRTMYDITPSLVVADFHPDYLSTKYAQQLSFPMLQIQHHAAHVFSCMAENRLKENVLGVSWDGTGYGEDGTIWGGEFFMWNTTEMKRVATFRSFPLPGGAAAIKEPRRTALGLLHEYSGRDLRAFADLKIMQQFSAKETALLSRMIDTNTNAPRTSSVGRLFDAVSSLLDLRHRTGYEGQAAMELESLAEQSGEQGSYPFQLNSPGTDGTIQVIDWEGMVSGIIEDLRKSTVSSVIARKFHNTLAEIIVALAITFQEKAVVLSGGCFQNAYLTERTILRLKENGFSPYWHQRIPPNDGGISLGQLYGAVILQNNK
jgi:hydrogenase maturation protein HypF